MARRFSRLSLRFLGGFEVQAGVGEPVTVPTRKAQALLAYLALSSGQAHPRDKLAALLWPDAAPGAARTALRQTLFVLRKALSPTGEVALLVTGDAIRLSEAAQTDVAAFEQAVAEGAPAALETAASLYRGDFLAGLAVTAPPFEDWLMHERERLRELAVEALARLLAHQRGLGATTAAVQTSLRLLALDPLQEVVHRALMQLYVEVGRRPAALRQYQICVDVLRRELDADPEPTTKALYRAILRTVSPAAPAAKALPSSDPEEAPTPGPAFVGRTDELTRLREAFVEACRGRGSAMLIVGETGVGKSRLVSEGSAAGMRESRRLVGHSYESERSLAFGPWLDAFRRGGISREADVLACLPLTSRMALARLFPEVGPPDAVDLSPIDARLLFEAVDQLVAVLAEDRPLVLALEDLHWADELSGQLFTFIARRSRSRPVLLVGTARAEDWSESAARPALDELDRDRRLGRLSLEPLSETETRELMRMLARTGTADEVERRAGTRIWTMSRGNPLVIVEAMHAFSTGTELDRKLARVPDRIRGLIASRVERLSRRARELAAVAAVIGRPFAFSLLQRASGVDAADAAAGIEELVRRHVLHGVGDGFDFRHDRIREVAYEALLAPRRVLLHRSVAMALEDSRTDDATDAVMAHHFRAGGVWDKAGHYFRSAGVRALARAAYGEAAERFSESLVALGRLEPTPAVLAQGVDIRLDLRTALVPFGDVARISDVLCQAAEAAIQLDDVSRQAAVSVYVVHHHWFVGDYAAALQEGERAARLAEAAGDRDLAALVDAYLGQIHFTVGNTALAVDHLRRAVKAPLRRPGATIVGVPRIPVQFWLVSAL